MNQFVRSLMAGLAVAWLVVAVGCDGNEKTSPEQPTRTPGQSTPTKELESPISGGSSCQANPRNDEFRDLLLSLENPICLGFGSPAILGMTISAELSGVGSKTHRVAAGETKFELPPDVSPYGPNGCQKNGQANLRIVVSKASGEETVRAVFSCSASTKAAGCLEVPHGEASWTNTTAAGTTCVSWRTLASDRTESRVEVTYPAIGAVWAYLVPATEDQLLLPDEASPRLDDSPARCRDRKNYVISIYELRAGQEMLVDSRAVEAECRIG